MKSCSVEDCKNPYRAREKWSARINVFGRTINLGRFDDIDEAKRARTNAEAKYFNKKEALCHN